MGSKKIDAVRSRITRHYGPGKYGKFENNVVETFFTISSINRRDYTKIGFAQSDESAENTVKAAGTPEFLFFSNNFVSKYDPEQTLIWDGEAKELYMWQPDRSAARIKGNVKTLRIEGDIQFKHDFAEYV